MAQDLYRNRDFIPDFDAIMAETAARSRELSARVDLRADIRYGPGPRERMDLILPPVLRSGAPVHMFVHGGYWRSGSKEDHRLVAGPVLAAGGLCAVITYDLMPATRLGAVVAQVRTAAGCLASVASGYGADPRRLSVSGHSAGAHLVSYLAASAPAEAAASSLPPGSGLPPLSGMLLLSGLYDLRGIPGSFLKDEAGMTMDEALAWSPVDALHLPGPRRIIAHGALETAPFHDQAKAMVAAIRDTRPEYRTEPALNHLTTMLALSDWKTPLGQCLADLVSA